MEPFLLTTLFFCAAVFYASVGFGGGSTYLALLVLFALPYTSIPQLALLCNITVAGGGTYHFLRAGHLNLTRALPFVIASIPCAYLGGRIPISKSVFLFLLGITLACAGLRLLIKQRYPVQQRSNTAQRIIGTGAGAGLGFLSGLVGIGGGIFLAPLLYFIGWGKERAIAGMASLFILVNSMAGLGGQIAKNGFGVDWTLLLPLLCAVFIGGQLGSRLAIGWLPASGLRRLTAAFVLFVSGRILWGLT